MCTFYNGQINSTAIEYYQNTYPTVYLKSSVKITGGTGKFDDPYTLSL